MSPSAAPAARMAAKHPLPPATVWRRRPAALWFIAVGMLAAALAASVGAPALAGAALQMALSRSFETGNVAVTVRSWPSSSLWWGNIGMLSISARSLRMGRLDVAAFDATLHHVDINPGLLYGSRQLAVRSVGGGTAVVVVSADNLARLVAAQPAVKQVVVHLSPGSMMLDGTVTVLGADFPASLAAHLVVRDAAHLDLMVDRVTVLGGLPVPPDVAARLADSVNPVLDVGRLPFELRLTGVAIGDGVVVLRASAGTAGSVPEGR